MQKLNRSEKNASGWRKLTSFRCTAPLNGKFLSLYLRCSKYFTCVILLKRFLERVTIFTILNSFLRLTGWRYQGLSKVQTWVLPNFFGKVYMGTESYEHSNSECQLYKWAKPHTSYSHAWSPTPTPDTHAHPALGIGCLSLFHFLRCYLFIFRDRGREGERKGKKHRCDQWPLLGNWRTKPTTQAFALTGNQTSDLLLC